MLTNCSRKRQSIEQSVADRWTMAAGAYFGGTPTPYYRARIQDGAWAPGVQEHAGQEIDHAENRKAQNAHRGGQ
jgi:hypothetical protein